jgi:cytochrome oxidase Cu insertion factor (SCO1/SenC/PrrC family)
MRFIRISLTLFLLSLGTASARGAAVPAPANAGRIPDIPVWDEANQQSSLWQKLQLAGDGPVILLPVYTRCTLSCPSLTRKLKQEAARLSTGVPFRVLLFSFDPAEDGQSLRDFRQREQLPADWLLVRTTDTNIRQFSDFFHYSILTEGSVLVHPNQLFLLQHNLRWRATLIDVDWDAAELRTWLSRMESPGLFGWLAMNPETLAWIGLGGLSLALAFMVSWLIVRKPSGRSAAA